MCVYVCVCICKIVLTALLYYPIVASPPELQVSNIADRSATLRWDVSSFIDTYHCTHCLHACSVVCNMYGITDS